MSHRKTPKGREVRTDPAAESADAALPAFLARPKGAPVYHGFPLVEETRTDGWCFGAITGFEDPAGCESGDGYVVAPDGSRAGLVWSLGSGATEMVREPDERRWGVYAVSFPRPVRTVEDLVVCFRAVLPELEALYARARPRWSSRDQPAR